MLLLLLMSYVFSLQVVSCVADIMELLAYSSGKVHQVLRVPADELVIRLGRDLTI